MGNAAENEALMRAVYDRLINGNSLDEVLRYYDEDIFWRTSPGPNPLFGDRRGREELRSYLELTAGAIEEFSLTLEAMVANDDEVISAHHEFIRRTDGRELDVDVCVRWRIANGKVTECWEFAYQGLAVHEFFMDLA